MKKQTQDLLHAELSNTLKRRKPVVINEPPKYEYPTYDDSNGTSSNGSNGITNDSGSSSSNNKSSVNNKINDSSHSTSVNIATPKPLNVNAVLSVVTGIKLPDTIQYDANVGSAAAVAAASASSTADKRKISHGKPNFTINHQKENKPIVVANQSSPPPRKASSPKMHVNGGTPVEIKVTTTPAPAAAVVQPKLQRPSYFTNHSMGSDKTIVKTTPMARPAIDTNGTESGQVEKCRSIFMIKSQKSQDDSAKQITKCPLKSSDSGAVHKFTNAASSIGVNEQPKPKPKEMVFNNNNNNKAKITIDESSMSSSSSPLSNGIPFASVANKKALFEKSAQIENHPPQKSPVSTLRGAQTEKLFFNKPVSSSTSSSPSSLSPPLTPSASASMSNGKANTLNGRRTNGHQKPGSITTVTLNKNTSYGGGSLDQPKYGRTPSTPKTKDAVDHFVHETATSKTTTTTTSTKTTKTLSTTNQFETKQQFEQKTIVSFSKDLLNAPNNYPEQIRVKKTIINETHRSPAIADTPFHNIRFSIQTNGQVIPKAK